MSKIVIFGASSAIAAEAARLFAARGDDLFLVARSQSKLDAQIQDLKVRTTGSSAVIASAVADLADATRHDALLDEATRALGGLDVVLVAHGSLPDQKACEASVEQTLAEINTNALSAISIATLAANRFEPQKKGVIAVIGSVAGDRGRQSNYVYGAAKGMVAIFLEGLRNRLAKSGVAVVTIKPGFVDTPMTAQFEKKGPLWAQPQDVAAGIVKAIDRRADVVYLPGFWRLIMLVIRHIPEFIFKKLSL
jgi:short-subunit dehydrogenase